DLDKRIISMLQANARIHFLEVARECGVSGAAIHQRVQRLKKLGVIKGAEYVIDPKMIGYDTCAFMGIFLEKASLFNDVVNQLKKIPEVTECHYTTGDYSIFIKIYAHNNEHLKQVLVDKLQTISGISRTDTIISLEENFSRQITMD
ncbi:MAG: Lrp/AsnC ligand binding domain-containing protein, partial [Bacteroidales bacterium]